jgi:putative transposase
MTANTPSWLIGLVQTTNSQHGLPIYPNLAEGMVLTGIDQLWVADITYIRLQVEFVYLAILLDAFSRRGIGWALRRSLEAALVLEALRMSLLRRRPRSGLVHHPTAARNTLRGTTPHYSNNTAFALA